MSTPEYPADVRRDLLLRAVNEWCEERTDARTNLDYAKLAEIAAPKEFWGTDREEIERSSAQTLNLFQRMVRENYIDADLKGGNKRGPPFDFAIIRGLTTKGLRTIQQSHDPQQELLNRLDYIAAMIDGLHDVPQEEKRSAATAVREFRHFLRGLPPGIAIELAKGFFS